VVFVFSALEWEPAVAFADQLNGVLLVGQTGKPNQAEPALRSRQALQKRGAFDEDQPEQDPPESFTKGFKALWDDSIYLVSAPARMTVNDTLVLGGTLATIGGLMAVDHGIRSEVQKNTSSSGRNVADGFNTIGSPAGILGLNVGLIAIGVTNWSYAGDSRVKDAALVSLESEVFSVGAVLVVKEIFGRARPYQSQDKGASHFSPFSSNDSLPSGHAAVSFATAAVFADRFEQPIPLIAYGLASAVALARVYTDQHFASDVVAGGALGWIIGKALSARHPASDSTIDIYPLAFDRGGALGIMVVKHF
jgi:membrane-associated phospholipid phosphatase